MTTAPAEPTPGTGRRSGVTTRLLLVRHPGTAATRAARIPDDEPPSSPPPDLSGWLGRQGKVLTSPAARCRVRGASVEPLLRQWDLGDWTGRCLIDVPNLAAWRNDPDYTGHGGESLLDLLARTRLLLDRWQARPGRFAMVTHAAVIRAAVTTVLAAPPQACWDIDVAPSSGTELHHDGRRWRLIRLNVGV